ncbi:MAG: sigma-70 family RNA polymerase sigma factor [Actinomycetota bacterium]|nr:sigma-70 family RNA polymerase sigma factor [Actinomycetota bacterium]
MRQSELDRENDTILLDAAEVVRRVVAHRTSNPDLVEDVTQETMARLVGQRIRLEDDAVIPFAIVTARNLLNSHARREDRDRRHAHRLVELSEPDRPEDGLLREEEQRAIRVALARLSDRDREALIAKETGGATTRDLAEAAQTSPGAIAVRMAAARAKLRVEYLLSYRKTAPPTPRCRPVLVALSAGDRRRQRALDAGEHLLDCDTCASLSEPLLQRKRLAAWWPFVLLPAAIRLALRAMKEHPAHSAASISVAAGLFAGAGLLLVDRPEPSRALVSVDLPTTSTTIASAIEVEGDPVLPLGSGQDLGRYASRAVNVRGATVQAVVADEGFWIGSDDQQRVWVQLLVGPGESAQEVRPGQRVSFDGIFVASPAGFAADVGVVPSEGAAQLQAQGFHIEVPAADARVEPG